ncbi:hypothetical protein T484DRAFT_1795745 [Baffinella frigidus]|nr:hypothetical protein T484DRAFT_1795745 [Cryptophyta sp. CCMP2293]
MSSTAEGAPAPEVPLFIYGSLMAEDVLVALIERTPTWYHRFCIQGRPYPAVAPQEDGTVAGLVLRGLTEEEHGTLDWFESDEYTKVEVEVEVEVTLADASHPISAPGYLPQTPVSGGGSIKARAYVYAEGGEQLFGAWDVEGFLRSKILKPYIENASLEW